MCLAYLKYMKYLSGLFSQEVVTQLEKEMANHSDIIAWEIPWTEAWGRKSIDHDLVTKQQVT